MRYYIFGIVFILACLPGYAQYFSIEFALTPCELEMKQLNAEIIKISKVKSREMYIQDSNEGKFFASGKLVKKELFNRNGMLAEEIYYNSQKETDSINVISYNEALNPIKSEMFKPTGELIRYNVNKYNVNGTLAGVYYYQDKSKLEHLTQFQYKQDTVLQYEIAEGKKLVKKLIVNEDDSEGCNNLKRTKTSFNAADTMVFAIKWEIKDDKAIGMIQYPETEAVEMTLNDFGFPILVKERRADNVIKRSTLYNYQRNGLVNGYAIYIGEYIAEEGNANYNIIEDQRISKNSHLNKIVKYKYYY